MRAYIVEIPDGFYGHVDLQIKDGGLYNAEVHQTVMPDPDQRAQTHCLTVREVFAPAEPDTGGNGA